MSKSTEIIVVATPDPESEPPSKKPNFVFPNFNFNFNLQQLPFFQPKHKPTTIIPNQEGEGDKSSNSNSVLTTTTTTKPNLVSFPNTQLVAVPPPLQSQPVIESPTKTSNPLIIYQVYAIAGFFLSKWILGRWYERNNRGRSPDDDSAEGRHSDDGLDNE